MSRMDNEKYYSDVVTRHGDSAQGVHWNSQATQYKRFEVLLKMIPLSSDDRLVDAGCGFGALSDYLKEKKIGFGAYRGLEVMETMVAAAQSRGLDVVQCDLLVDPLEVADYYICSGAMNILSREETDTFIRRCFDASTKGFVFNLLEGDDDSLLYNYWRPEEIEMMAEKMGADCKIVRGYLPKDFSVFLAKQAEDG